MTSALTKVPGLRLTARRLAAATAVSRADPVAVGRALSVRHVLTGSVRRSDGRVRVVSTLITVPQGDILWSDRIEGPAGDVFAVQDSITSAIVEALRPMLGAGATAATRRGRTKSPEAYDLYLRARALVARASVRDIRAGIELLDQAVAIDPRYADALALMGGAWGKLAEAYLQPGEAYPRARDALRRALAIDSANADALATMGFVTLILERDTASALRMTRRAIRMDSASFDAAFNNALILALAGDPVEALRAGEGLLTLDSTSTDGVWVRQFSAYVLRRADIVEREHRRLMRIDPGYLYIDVYFAAALRERGALDSSLAEYDRAAERAGTAPLYGRAITLARLGRTVAARDIAAALERRRRESYVSPDDIAAIYVALGEHDTALQWLERLVAEPSSRVFTMQRQPEFAPLRRDSRFRGLLERVNRPVAPGANARPN